LKTVNGESFEIRREESNSTVVFKGALRLSGTADYAPILEMLRETFITTAKPIVLDLRELDFLNSSGITMLSRFIIEARDCAGIQVEILASEAIPWHARSLKNLQRLMPALNIRLV
jgi:hypothetical protein